MKKLTIGIVALNVALINSAYAKDQVNTTANTPNTVSYPIVDTGQKKFYSNDKAISLPATGSDFFGQDASYIINDPSYTNNNDGTITDNVTGLMWQQGLTEKLSYDEALQQIKTFKLAGHSDWRIATLKELYSLIQFTGSVKGAKAINPFIDTNYFTQPLGDASQGEREIDAQVWGSTEYVGKTMKNDDTVFGVNFVDGRIKGYPKYNPKTREPNKMYFRFVRGNSEYGENKFVDNNNGTISDTATGLTWQKADSNKGMNWQAALQFCENLTLAENSDWRLPSAKELQSIVDYSRSPETSNSAAIDPIFQTSTFTNEGGEKDYPYFWSSTTHLDGQIPEKGAVYVAFGRSLGKMNNTIMDVHGAGSQRSDPKTGEPMSRGPQGDMIRVDNYVRCVSGGIVNLATSLSMENINTYSVSAQKGNLNSQDKNSSQNNNSQNNNPKNNNNSQRNSGTQNKNASSSSNNTFIICEDKNGDGKVSSSEFGGDPQHFIHLDKNKDGYITTDEAPKGRR